MLCCSLIHSKLCYSIESWGNASWVHLDRLIKFQKKIVCIIHRKTFGYHSKYLFRKSDILPVDKLFKYKLLIKAHKIYYSGSFSTHSHYATRHQLQSLPVPFYSSFAGQRTSNFVISALWNKLPKFLKIIPPLGKFKTELRHHLHSVE